MREEAAEWTLGPDNLAIPFCLLASNVLTQLTNLQLPLLTFSTFDISAISALTHFTPDSFAAQFNWLRLIIMRLSKFFTFDLYKHGIIRLYF